MATKINKAIQRIKRSPRYMEESLRGEISDAIDSAMKANGVTRSELARRLGVNRVNVTRYLQGNNNFEVSTLARIAFALGVVWQIQVAPKPVSKHSTRT